MSVPIDTYRDAFLYFLRQGMTHAEALDQFNQKEWNAALKAEIESGEAAMRFNMKTMQNEPISGKVTLLQLAGVAARESMNQEDMKQAIELWLAGWTSETPYKTQVDVMSWYWRRPPRRKGKPGRRYLSTNQAFNAMKRESAPPSTTRGEP